MVIHVAALKWRAPRTRAGVLRFLHASSSVAVLKHPPPIQGERDDGQVLHVGDHSLGLGV